jgi:hypothetical protein|tara:strand:+ start:1361 stop:2197 length:837 start_codon:yes stop_codon:yes gene_type:complete
MATTKALELGQLGRKATIDSASVNIETLSSVDSAAILGIVDSAVGPLLSNTFVYTATSGQSAFTGADNNSSILNYTAGNILVQVNGVIQVTGVDYTATNGSTVTLTDAADSGDAIVISAFNTGNVAFGQAVEQDFKYNIAGTPSVVEDSDTSGNILSINTLGTIVTLNGLTMRPITDYTLATDKVTFTSPLDSGDEVMVRSYNTLTVADTVSATNGGTFTGHVTAKTITTSQPFHINSQTVTEDFTLSAGNNAMAAGPITINSGKTITLQAGTRWVVV